MDPKEQKQIRREMNMVMNELKSKGIKHNTTEEEMTGLGDVVEETLQRFGITEDRFKAWFNLKECNCSKRKKFLNNLFSWRKNSQE